MDTGTIIAALRDRGLDADEMWGPSPTEIQIEVPAGKILITREFNITGWEAQLDRYTDGEYTDSECLNDGPTDANAPAEEVANWAVQIAQDLVG